MFALLGEEASAILRHRCFAVEVHSAQWARMPSPRPARTRALLAVLRFGRLFRGAPGHPRAGRWIVTPRAEAKRSTRRYRDGSIVPWVRKEGPNGIRAIAGPDVVRMESDVPLHGENMTTVADFDVAAGQTLSFRLTWHPAHIRAPAEIDGLAAVADAQQAWSRWAARCTYRGPWRDIVLRSLVTLKALTHAKTGGISAAATTSRPEAIGGVRNWDYRFCWVRDATFTLLALVQNGFLEEAAPRRARRRTGAGSGSPLRRSASDLASTRRSVVRSPGFKRKACSAQRGAGAPWSAGVAMRALWCATAVVHLNGVPALARCVRLEVTDRDPL